MNVYTVRYIYDSSAQNRAGVVEKMPFDNLGMFTMEIPKISVWDAFYGLSVTINALMWGSGNMVIVKLQHSLLGETWTDIGGTSMMFANATQANPSPQSAIASVYGMSGLLPRVRLVATIQLGMGSPGGLVTAVIATTRK